MTPVAMTIAGSDPSGGAGIQADLKTFHAFGVYGEAAITLLTVQNTTCVSRVETVPPDLVIAQIRAVVEDIPPQAVKTGAMGSRAVVEAVAGELRFPAVVDPVMISKHGMPLVDADARTAIRRLLLPRAALVTPNIPEAEELAGFRIESVEEMEDAARALCDLGSAAALVKGGHMRGDAVDVLCAGGRIERFSAARIHTRHTHGTGCTYSAAIAAGLARGDDLFQAVASAKRFLTEAIRTNPGLGRGCGPINHHARISL